MTDQGISQREATLLEMGLNPDEFVESKIDPAQFELAAWPNAFKDLDTPCHPCAMCGHLIRWAVGFRHLPSGELILVGEDCADYLDSDNVVEKQMKQFKTKIANQKKAETEARERALRKAQYRNEHPEVVEFLAQVQIQEMQYREADKPTNIKAPMPFLLDIAFNLNKWGSLTENQTNAVKKIMLAQAEKAAEMARVQPLLGGKRLCEGEVVGLKWDDSSYYGSTYKMTVKLIDGNRVFGTVPKSVADVEKGQKISFFANVMVSNKDEHFGFFKNPSKAVIERG